MAGKVKCARFLASAGSLLLLIGAGAAAQSHGGGLGHPAGGAVRSARVAPIRPGSRVGTPLNPNFAPIGTVPGLSFNLQGLAAADRRNFARGRGGQFGTPLLWYSPFYTPYLDYSYDQPQPPYDYEQLPQQQSPQAAQFDQSEPAPAPEAAEPQPPPPEVGQFVLVRMDGRVIFASAFTTVDGRVTYITREGLRRSFPLSELDKDATREMNEANGTSVSLPD